MGNKENRRREERERKGEEREAEVKGIRWRGKR